MKTLLTLIAVLFVGCGTIIPEVHWSQVNPPSKSMTPKQREEIDGKISRGEIPELTDGQRRTFWGGQITKLEMRLKKLEAEKE